MAFPIVPSGMRYEGSTPLSPASLRTVTRPVDAGTTDLHLGVGRTHLYMHFPYAKCM